MAKDLTLTGLRILVVEDDYFVADDLVAALEAWGAEIVGPVASLSRAMTLIEDAGRLDGAILDINLQGELVYPLADALQERSVPFVFATGYDAQTVPSRYAHVSVCEKPFESGQITKAMFG